MAHYIYYQGRKILALESEEEIKEYGPYIPEGTTYAIVKDVMPWGEEGKKYGVLVPETTVQRTALGEEVLAVTWTLVAFAVVVLFGLITFYFIVLQLTRQPESKINYLNKYILVTAPNGATWMMDKETWEIVHETAPPEAIPGWALGLIALVGVAGGVFIIYELAKRIPT
jgi:hypothetical protein